MNLSDSETFSPAVFYLLCKYRIKHWSLHDINYYQKNKLFEISNYAFKHSQFFSRFYKNNNLNDFFSLPTVNKQLMMDNFSDYNTLGLKKEEVVNFALDLECKRDFSSRFQGLNVGMSSGTSGNKGIILTTRREELYLKAMYFSRLILPSGQKLNCAFILRVSSPAFNFNFLGNSLVYISQLQPIEQVVSQINKIHPNVISAPASMLKLLANEKEQGRLNVSPVFIYTYAEVLYPDVRQYIKRIFDCHIHEIYQGSEGCYAMTCRNGRLHINEDIVYFELFNRDGTPTPIGKPCYRLLVTDLHKHSQPIIRYELNDIITLSPILCSCGSGFRVIDSIQGRADNLFWGLRNNSRQKQFIYPDYIARKIISLSEGIEDYQAIQNDYTNIVIRIKLKPDADKHYIIERIKAGIKEIFKAYDCLKPEVTVEIGEPLKNIRSSKLIRIISNIKESNL
jgi:putative adenylate-forming enzyme